jgi:hypothetical protein
VWGDEAVAYIADRHGELQGPATVVASSYGQSYEYATAPPEGWEAALAVGWGLGAPPELESWDETFIVWAAYWPAPGADGLVQLAQEVRTYRAWLDHLVFHVGGDRWDEPDIDATLAEYLKLGNRLCGELLQECWVFSQLCSKEARRLRA